jgi:hypothetical protein
VLYRAPAEERGVIPFSLGGLMKRFVTRALIVVAAILGMVFAQAAPASASAPDDSPSSLASNLATLWTAVLQTPSSESPVLTDHACWDLGDNTVAPFFGSPDLECTVGTDTKLFVAGWSTECSTFDDDCARTSDPQAPCAGNSLGELLACAIKMDKPHRTPTITIDGSSVKVTQVTTTMPNLVLPEDNIFDKFDIPTPGGPGQSAAHGWVALVGPLPVGSHTIVITDPTGTTTTKIVVK